MHSKAIMFTLILCCLVSVAWADSNAVKLTKIDVLTLRQGMMTNGRRSPSVPQLKCVAGGTAGCTTFVPKVAQCKNIGFDGIDVKWQCGSDDLGKLYQFGKISVGCEGYSYPEDPLVLTGSCGLEYTLDLTAEGIHQRDNRIQLNTIEVLKLTQNLMTTGRRLSPIPQIKCVGGTAGCYSFVPKVINCYNQGSDGSKIQWECKAENTPNTIGFNKIVVKCEPYSDAKDTYILKGSCGLEYTMDLTLEGQQQLSKNRVLLNIGDVLTLTLGKLTNARRSPPVLQMRCIAGGTAGCQAFVPQVIQCVNKGSDEWNCDASIRSIVYRFSKIEVNCEGYDYPKDPYILKGSCGLQYNLDFVPIKIDDVLRPRVNNDDNKKITDDGSFLLGLWIFLGILGLVVIGLVIWGIVVCVQSSSDGTSYSGGSSYRSRTYVSEPPVYDRPTVVVVGSQPPFTRPFPPPYAPTAPIFSGPSPSSGTRTASGFGGTEMRQDDFPPSYSTLPSSGTRTASGFGGTEMRQDDISPSSSSPPSAEPRSGSGTGGTTRR